jgi:hypothetical protein
MVFECLELTKKEAFLSRNGECYESDGLSSDLAFVLDDSSFEFK